jgi:hypothetical protein
MSVKRRKTGATLGLVAVCVLVIILLGIGFFFLSKIFGGEREVAGATDSGTLNVAKTALRSQQASTPIQSDFVMLEDSKFPGQATLFSYNRCVAQTLLVLLNAQHEQAQGAGLTPMINANKVLAQLKTEGAGLQAELTSPSTFIADFSTLTGDNNTRMAGNNGVNQVDYKSALMYPGWSTNIYFNTASFPDTTYATSLNMFNTTNVNLTPTDPSANPKFYLAGYNSITIPGANDKLVGVPVFPQTKPHLVSLNDFNGGGVVPNFVDPTGWTPPNAFKVASSSLDSKAQVFGGATACAIVGATQNPGGPAADFLGAMPGAYIAINNANPANMGGLWGPADGSNSIFNNELWNAPGIQATSAGSSEIFTTDTNQPAAWSAYNATYNASATVGTAIVGSSPPALYDANKRNPNLYPPSLGFSIGTMYTATSPGAYAASTIPDLLQIGAGGTNCENQLNANGVLSGACQNYLTSFEGAYGRNMGAAPPLVGNQFTDMDQVKLQIVNAFQTGNQSVSVNANLPPSGMGVLKNPAGWYPFTNAATVPLETSNGTILQMLQQIGQNQATVISDITQRCNEMSPGVSAAQVQALLNTPLKMGQTLYIHLQNPKVVGSPLVCDLVIPTTVTGVNANGLPNTVPDGVMVTGTKSYDLLALGMADTISANGSNGGDNNLHERPYRDINPPDGLTATDTVQWTTSSGYQNMVGELKFFQTTQGADAFSKPN